MQNASVAISNPQRSRRIGCVANVVNPLFHWSCENIAQQTTTAVLPPLHVATTLTETRLAATVPITFDFPHYDTDWRLLVKTNVCYNFKYL